MPENHSDIFARFTTGGRLDLDQLRRQFSQSTANELVSLTRWQVQFPPDLRVLEALCTVAPKNSEDAISGVYIATLSPDGSIVYARGGTNVNESTVKALPGAEFSVASATALWSSKTQGEEVLCVVSGTIEYRETFYFEQTFTVSS